MLSSWLYRSIRNSFLELFSLFSLTQNRDAIVTSYSEYSITRTRLHLKHCIGACTLLGVVDNIQIWKSNLLTTTNYHNYTHEIRLVIQAIVPGGLLWFALVMDSSYFVQSWAWKGWGWSRRCWRRYQPRTAGCGWTWVLKLRRNSNFVWM